MKIILIALTLLAVALLFVFCKQQPKFTAENLPPQQLRWGTGGGIVGKETTSILLQNGQVFRRDVAGVVTQASKTKSKTAASLFKTAESLNISKLEFNHPGNIYSFLEWQDGDAVQRMVWGDAQQPVDPGVKALFDRLNGLLK
jgi:hypothetical protein